MRAPFTFFTSASLFSRFPPSDKKHEEEKEGRNAYPSCTLPPTAAGHSIRCQLQRSSSGSTHGYHAPLPPSHRRIPLYLSTVSTRLSYCSACGCIFPSLSWPSFHPAATRQLRQRARAQNKLQLGCFGRESETAAAAEQSNPGEEKKPDKPNILHGRIRIVYIAAVHNPRLFLDHSLPVFLLLLHCWRWLTDPNTRRFPTKEGHCFCFRPPFAFSPATQQPQVGACCFPPYSLQLPERCLMGRFCLLYIARKRSTPAGQAKHTKKNIFISPLHC